MRDSPDKLSVSGNNNNSATKRMKTINKRVSVIIGGGIERRISNVEAYLEDNADFEYIYIEMKSND